VVAANEALMIALDTTDLVARGEHLTAPLRAVR
jgi:hypothetical protein